MRHDAMLLVGLLACAFVLGGCETESASHPALSTWQPTVPLRGTAAPVTCTNSTSAAHAYAPPPSAPPAPPPAPHAATVVKANDANFDSELAAAGSSAVINFTAKWCAPCKAMCPTVDSLAADGTTRVIRVDFDESPATVRRYGVSALPAILVVRNGVVVKRVVGYQSRENLATAFASALP